MLYSQDRRKLTHEENIKLVEALLEHYGEENDKQETILQPNYLKILKEKFSKTLSNSMVKTTPHIQSRLKN